MVPFPALPVAVQPVPLLDHHVKVRLGPGGVLQPAQRLGPQFPLQPLFAGGRGFLLRVLQFGGIVNGLLVLLQLVLQFCGPFLGQRPRQFFAVQRVRPGGEVIRLHIQKLGLVRCCCHDLTSL